MDDVLVVEATHDVHDGVWRRHNMGRLNKLIIEIKRRRRRRRLRRRRLRRMKGEEEGGARPVIRMLVRNLLPRPSPLEAPLTRPAMSTYSIISRGAAMM